MRIRKQNYNRRQRPLFDKQYREVNASRELARAECAMYSTQLTSDQVAWARDDFGHDPETMSYIMRGMACG